MAIQDDIMNLLRQVGDAGDLATRRGKAGLAILDKLTPRERSLLSSSFSPEQYSSLEEAIMSNPLIGGQALDMYTARVGTGVEPDEVTGPSETGSIESMVKEMTDVVGSRAVPRRKPTPPGGAGDTRISISKLPPVDSTAAASPSLDPMAAAAMLAEAESMARGTNAGRSVPSLDPMAAAAMLAEAESMARGDNTGLSSLIGGTPVQMGGAAGEFTGGRRGAVAALEDRPPGQRDTAGLLAGTIPSLTAAEREQLLPTTTDAGLLAGSSPSLTAAELRQLASTPSGVLAGSSPSLTAAELRQLASTPSGVLAGQPPRLTAEEMYQLSAQPTGLMQGQPPSLTGPDVNQFFQPSDIRRGGSMAGRPGSVMGDIRRQIESSIGPIAELPPDKQEMAIRLMETQYRQEAAGRRGATPDAETEALNLGMDVASGVLPAMAALRIARAIPGAAERLSIFLHNRGLMPKTARTLERLPEQINNVTTKLGQMKKAFDVRGTEYDPKMYRTGGKVRMLGGGNVRQAMIDRYNRMY